MNSFGFTETEVPGQIIRALKCPKNQCPQVEQLPPEHEPQLSELEDDPKLEILVICFERIPPHFSQGGTVALIPKRRLSS